mgnify:CR=1 FL=1
MLKELGAAAIEAAGAAENSGKKVRASFAGTDAAAWVDNYAASVHRSTAEVQSFMVSNKAMYGEMGITGDAASELSKITTSLAYDFGNAFPWLMLTPWGWFRTTSPATAPPGGVRHTH